MSVAGSTTSSRGTTSRSPSRSRSPPYSDGRYLSRYAARYDSSSYRPGRSGMSAALDDYRELRDRERDRERDRPAILPRDDRYTPRLRDRDDRYTPYYRDDMSFSPSSFSPSYSKPSSTLRRDNGSLERVKPASDTSSNKDTKEEAKFGDSYTPSTRYTDWRDRDRDRDTWFRTEERRRDFERRNRERDSYIARYEHTSYGPPPPPSTIPYSIPPFGGDSYRPDRDRDRERDRDRNDRERDRDRELQSPSSHGSYFERERMEERDVYRPSSRGATASTDFDRYRSRSVRTTDRACTPNYNSSGVLPPKSEIRHREKDRSHERGNQRIALDVGVQKDRAKEETTTSTTSSSAGDNSQSAVHHESTRNSEPITSSPDSFKNSLLIGDSKLIIDAPLIAEATDMMTSKDELTVNVAPDVQSFDQTAEVTTPTVPMNNDFKQDRSKTIPGETVDHNMLEALGPQLDTTNVNSTMNIPTMTTLAPATMQALSESLDSNPELSHNPEQQIQQEAEKSKGQEEESHQPSPIMGAPTIAPHQVDVPPQQDNLLEPQLTQQQIVERIDQIENDISMYEDMLLDMANGAAAQASRNTTISSSADITPDELPPGEVMELDDDFAEEARNEMLQIISETNPRQALVTIDNLPMNNSSRMRRRPQLLINQLRFVDEEEDRLCEEIFQENRRVAKENSRMLGGWQGKSELADDWDNETTWVKPLHDRIEDYPCFQNNLQSLPKLKNFVAKSLATNQKLLRRKQLQLKQEYKDLYLQWKEKNLALDRIRAHERRLSDKYACRNGSRRRAEDEIDDSLDGAVLTSEHDALLFQTEHVSTPFGPGQGQWTSDAVRSEAELLEIIQSLETAEMRNPEFRAAKTTATIPAMILDTKERTRTYDDRSGLIDDPLTYYHTGPDTEDVWTQQEMTAFMESYMQCPKQFEKIAAAVKSKTAPQCVLFYYRKKTKIDFKALMRKGRRGKFKRRDRLAAAIRRATGDSTIMTRKAKSKGSALMTDIGEAQVSRKAKEKESERKSRELRDLEEANAYWESVAERKKAKAKSVNERGFSLTSATISPTDQDSIVRSDDNDSGRDKRRMPRRKGRPSSLVDPSVLAAEIGTTELPMGMYSTSASPPSSSLSKQKEPIDENADSITPTARWSDRDKDVAIEAFKEHKRDFAQVSLIVGTKTEEQCRNFYHNFKRKYGPNAFNEETLATAAADPLFSKSSEVKPTASKSHALNAEEEDAAAALVGLCQMGVVNPSSEQASSSSSPILPASIVDERASGMSGSRSAPSSQGRRRRARTLSSKMEHSRDDLSDGVDGYYSGRSPAKTNRSALLDSKRPNYSSYWSISERGDFMHYLEQYGRDWDKVANAMKSKTAIQVRNFYVNNEEKMRLKEIVQRFHARQEQNAREMPLMGSAFDSAHTSTTTQPHFQTVQRFQFPTPIPTESIVKAPSYVMPRVGYFTPTHRATPSGEPPQRLIIDHRFTGQYNSPSSDNTMPYHGPVPPAHYSEKPLPMSAPTGATVQPVPSAVTKVADLLNNDDPAETKKQSWETWFGS
ncbi:uncharacterized protein BYT42DRAFT_605598 [Radiomyces spectabilis]|uniref:uncharacterized protein n=1 Tax=Radiomyces spectabilis TaxID=64574 RepID=UPI00221F2AAB|nr:uncharacterized protein BYT42DRAFT_605598 [Radiomyces spectabilis]KAI8375907.1 hypothetical protein BYT42DRAFT_605598 [Radiomyces spectabilis]